MTQLSPSPGRASGKPSKLFFVDMITRDLTVEDCILDLIDNAVDAAVTRQSVDVMGVLPGRNGDGETFASAIIRLTIDQDRFVIEDTCGGISAAEARDSVFRFGNPGERPPEGGLSVYGIGMKRSFFKLGKSIRVESSTETERFSVDIDVDEWTNRGDDDWDFAFDEIGDAAGDPGTVVTVGDLTPDTRRRFGAPAFAKELLKRIEATYALFLVAGLVIEVNGSRAVDSLPAEVLDSDEIRSAPSHFTADEVDVYIIVGVSPVGDRRRHGWYVFCNGRMVLDADKTAVTGWGRDVAQWHTKFGHFVGYLYFRSADVRRLPWRTTKQGVVTELGVYQKALAEMQVQMRPVLNFLSKLYPGEQTAEDVHERTMMREAKSKAITSLGEAGAGFTVKKSRKPEDPAAKLINIQYKKREGDIDRLRHCVQELNGESAKRVGEYAFEYLIKQECEG